MNQKQILLIIVILAVIEFVLSYVFKQMQEPMVNLVRIIIVLIMYYLFRKYRSF